MQTRKVEMTINELQLQNFLFNSLADSTKDKTVSFRVEESVYKLLQDLAKELETETISQTARKILYFYLLNVVYEEEWETVQAAGFEQYIQELKEAGDKIELLKYKNLLEKLHEYVQFMRSIIDRMRITEEFFSNEINKLEEVTTRLENVKIVLEKK